MLGAFAVGKTSLVSQFVHSIFSEKYLTTVGVKIDKKPVVVGSTELVFVIWDIYGHDDYQKVQASYLRGSSGYLLVVDGTRRDTIDTAIALHDTVVATIGTVPFAVVVNKADLEEQWQVTDDNLESLRSRGWQVLKTSAKTGAHVEEAFAMLAHAMLQQ